jgi:hypothetical protein
LARRIQQLTAEARDLERCIRDAVAAHSPQLLERVGIGPDCAAALLIAAGDNPERLQSEASFAALCGVSPVEASSGKTQRRRLNRGGDRQTNAALYRIVLSRLRWDQRTRDYLERHLAEGKTRREIIRCIKRYVAREIHNLTHRPAHPAPSLTCQKRLDKHRGIYGTHKTPAIKAWLARHPRFHMHFTPIGSSWINQVERWFGFLTEQMIRRGVHKSVQSLEQDIRDWIAEWNDNPRPFVWKKTAEEILESLAKYCRRISGA